VLNEISSVSNKIIVVIENIAGRFFWALILYLARNISIVIQIDKIDNVDDKESVIKDGDVIVIEDE
jgi:molybdopterin converting factor small subunit